VFYLANGDPKGAAAFLKSMIKIRDPYVDEHNNLLSLRDSLENIQLAERLITLFDNPEAEVLIDAQVLEVDATRLTELGIDFPNQITLTPFSTSVSNSTSSSTGSASFTLNDFPLRKGNLAIGIPSATLNLQSQFGKVNTLANPQIRTRSREKARILIGDKIPTITTTTTPGVAGFVSESVTYQDVGIKLEVEPTVYPDDDVAIRLNLEVSALGTQIKTASGTIAYQISTRDASTVLRLRDGETQLLAGLISSDERTSASRLPGLGDLPILGRLFSDQTDSHNRTELVLAITPHIVRGQPHLDAAEAEAWVGTEAYQRLKPAGGRFDVEAVRGPAAPTPNAARPTVSPGAGASVQGTAAVGTAAAPVATGDPAVVTWIGPIEVHAGSLFEVELQLRSGIPLGALGLELRYPANLVGLVGPVAATIPEAQASGDLSAHSEPDNVGVLDVPRLVPNAPDGIVSLVRLQFKALSAGEMPLTVRLKPVDGGPKLAMPAPLALKILP
jgi:general secretion pathway protein D